MTTAAKALEEATPLPEDASNELAANAADNLERLSGVSIDDSDEIEACATETRSGAGVAWDETKCNLAASIHRELTSARAGAATR